MQLCNFKYDAISIEYKAEQINPNEHMSLQALTVPSEKSICEMQVH